MENLCGSRGLVGTFSLPLTQYLDVSLRPHAILGFVQAAKGNAINRALAQYNVMLGRRRLLLRDVVYLACRGLYCICAVL